MDSRPYRMDEMNTRDEPGVPGGQNRTPLLHLPLTILFVGRDGNLLKMRREALSRRLRLRAWSGTPEQARSWSQSSDPHLWVFCSTVEVQELIFLAGRIRRFSPRSRLVLMEDAHASGPEAVLFNRVVRSQDGIDGLCEILVWMATAP
jgi:hypothetical protein